MEQSRQAYLETERQANIHNTDKDIVTDDESDNISPDDWLDISDIDSDAAKNMIVKQRKINKQKAREKAPKAVLSLVSI